MAKEDRVFNDTTPFAPPFSVLDNPRLEFVMEVRLTFPEVHTIAPHPNGGMRSGCCKPL